MDRRERRRPPRIGRRSALHGDGLRQGGQALVEFALILPILLGLFGAGLDYARFESTRTKLEAATRNAAEYAATKSTSSSQASSDAQRLVCAEFGKGPTCTDPDVKVMWYEIDTAATGASTRNPLVTVSVLSTTPFQTLVPYPLITNNGEVTLAAAGTYSILQGR